MIKVLQTCKRVHHSIYNSDIGECVSRNMLRLKQPGKYNSKIISACQYANVTIVRILVNNGGGLVKFRCSKAYVNWALCVASAHGKFELVRYLVADEKSLFSNGGIYHRNIALCKASSHGHFDIVKYLISNGGIYHRNDALREASAKGHLEIVKYLESSTSLC